MNILDSLNKPNRVKIYVCISASFELNGLKHFVASTHYEYNNLDIEYIKDLSGQLKRGGWNRLLIVKIHRDGPLSFEIRDRVLCLRASLSEFYSILNTLDGYPTREFSQVALGCSLFIFENIRWKEVLESIRIYDALLTGGSMSKRHIISPVEARLVTLLMLLKGTRINSFYHSFHELSVRNSIGAVSKDFSKKKYKGKKQDMGLELMESEEKMTEIFSSLEYKFKSISNNIDK